MIEDSTPQITASSNIEHWMRDLPSPLRDYPIIFLAIPGSHNSMTYGINRSSKLAPDADPAFHRFYPLFKGTIIRWTKTQHLDAMQQLLAGIRYFDLRVAAQNGTDNIHFTHGLYAEEISNGLEQIKDFVDGHPEEVVILDFQHFYSFSPEHHYRLMRYLLNLYGRRLVQRELNLQSLTLNSLSRLRQQVIIVYRHQSVFSSNEFWQPQMLPSPWPQQDSTRGLVRYLENVKRHPGTGFVHQAVITPNAQFILLRLFSSIRERCAMPVLKDVLPIITRDLSPGVPKNGEVTSPINVVIADFIDLNDNLFPKSIIALNNKLLNSNIRIN